MRFRRGRYFALMAVLGAPAVTHAQGFGLNEIGSCAVGRGSATTGAPCEDASSIFWNPAAGTRLPGWSVLAGVALLKVEGEFIADSSGRVSKGNVPTEFPPHLFVNYKGNHRYSLGAGIYVPYGLTSQWQDDFPGRFSVLRASVETFYFQPNISFDLTPGWAIGGGPVIGYSKVGIKQSLDFSAQPIPGRAPLTFANLGIAPGTEFGQASLRGNGTGFGFHIGVHGRIGNSLQIGARFLSSIQFDYEDAEAEFLQIPTGLTVADSITGFQLGGVPRGTPYDAILGAQFRSGGPLVAQKVNTTITHPGQIQVGIGYTIPTGTLLSLDAIHIRWSKFDELPVNFQGPARGTSRVLFEDYDDSYSVRAGIEHKFGSRFRNVALRGGFSFVQTPAPDETVTPLLPDQDRKNYAFGFGLPINSRYAVDLSYLKVDTDGRRGRIAERTDRSQTAERLNSGFYRLNADVVSLSLKARF